MSTVVTICIFVCCAGIAYQDFTSRLISVILFGVLGIVLLLNHILYNANAFNNTVLLTNFLFIVGQVVVLFFYTKYIRKNRARFFDTVFGLGDLFMMFLLALFFPLPGLLLLFLVSYSIALLYGVLTRDTGLPLAGVMALCFAFVHVLNISLHQPLILPFTP